MEMATRALVVGGTGGIGYAIACRLAAESSSATVIISGRTRPQSIPNPNIEFRQLDASSMHAIKQYTDDHRASQEPALDLLVLTQGILTMAGRTETPAEGLDNKMALHHYGRHLLIRELGPALKDDAKVLIVLDGTRGNPAQLIWEDLDLKRNYSIRNAANHCISMTDAMIQHYAKRQQEEGKNQRRHFVHASPGIVKTGLFDGLPWHLRMPSRLLGSLLGVAPETCAENLVRGMYDAAAAGEKEGRFWSCIDGNGKLVGSKPVWSEEQIKKVAEHTWSIVDEAINANAKKEYSA